MPGVLSFRGQADALCELLGLARLLYARIFQSAAVDENHSPIHLETSDNYSLPAAPGTPVTGLAAWRQNTGEIANTPERN